MSNKSFKEQTLEIKALLDSPIAFQRVFVTVGGSIKAGLMLSQLLYWSQRTNDPEGWLWKTQEQWMRETGLTRHQQGSARKQLLKRGLILEKRRGLSARLFFRLNVEIVRNAILKTQPLCTESAEVGESGGKLRTES